MIDHRSIQLALRTKLNTLEVCTTGAVSISATATGYARTSGSFLTDGFKPGMEVTGTGFAISANNSAKTITAVAALSLTCSGCSVEAAGSRTLTVGVPAMVVWENIKKEPVIDDPFFEENYLPGPAEAITMGATAELEYNPTYVVKIYVPKNVGMDGARDYADALHTLFAPRTPLTVSGHTVTVRTRPAPYSGQLLQTESHAVIPFTVPLHVRTANSI